MKTHKQILRLAAGCGLLFVAFCSFDSSMNVDYESSREIRPICKLARSMSIDEIARAEASVSGGGIDGTKTFELMVDNTARKLYGTLKLPEEVTSCDVVVYLYDDTDRKIGQGSHTLTQSHFDAGRCVTAEIGIESAKPRVDSIYWQPAPAIIRDTIVLRATVADSFGGSIEKYEWKIGNGQWIQTGTSDTTITGPSTAQFYPCTLRVTDNDGNIVYAGLAVSVSELVIDADGNEYSTVLIGDQIWTVGNLRTTKYNDGTSIPHVTDGGQWSDLASPAYCWYENSTDATSQEKWGALYNWYAVNTGKLSPAGWRVATYADWDKLERYLIANGYNWDSTTTGNKIGKALAATTLWTSHTIAGSVGKDITGNNSTGFSALPGGLRNYDGSFKGRGNIACWWIDKDSGETNPGLSQLTYDCEALDTHAMGTKYGYSVRLVRDLN